MSSGTAGVYSRHPALVTEGTRTDRRGRGSPRSRPPSVPTSPIQSERTTPWRPRNPVRPVVAARGHRERWECPTPVSWGSENALRQLAPSSTRWFVGRAGKPFSTRSGPRTDAIVPRPRFHPPPQVTCARASPSTGRKSSRRIGSRLDSRFGAKRYRGPGGRS